MEKRKKCHQGLEMGRGRYSYIPERVLILEEPTSRTGSEALGTGASFWPLPWGEQRFWAGSISEGVSGAF